MNEVTGALVFGTEVVGVFVCIGIMQQQASTILHGKDLSQEIVRRDWYRQVWLLNAMAG